MVVVGDICSDRSYKEIVRRDQPLTIKQSACRLVINVMIYSICLLASTGM